MGTLDVVYKVAADISGLQDGMRRAAQATEGLQTTVSNVGTALAAAFSFNAVAGLASRVTEATGRLTDLAAKAGISSEAVQELDFVAKQSGSTFDEVSGAMARMA